MFSSSRFPMPAPAGAGAAAHQSDPGEGRASELSRRATAAILLPQGRPGPWLLLLAGACFYVVIQALTLQVG
jgi:hypothetical protein